MKHTIALHKYLLPLTLLFAFPAAACKDTQAAAAGCEDWDYEDGECGPDSWSLVDSAYATCADGVEQSPLDLLPGDQQNPPILPEGLSGFAGPTQISIANDGRMLAYHIDPGNLVTLFTNNEADRKDYELLRFEFHAQSEHTIAGVHYPMEMQVVSQASDGEYLIVAVLFEEEAEADETWDPVFDDLLWTNAPTVPGGTFEDPTVFELDIFNDMIGGNNGQLPFVTGWHYAGSLTTPPCTEGVQWFVYEGAVPVSSRHLDVMRNLYDHNYRPTQPVGDRTVAYGLY